MASFVGRLEPYVIGENFDCYVERMRYMLTLNKLIKEEEKMPFLISVGGSELHRTLKTLIHPLTLAETTFEKAIAALSGYFNKKKNVTAERFKFLNRVQQVDESVSDYVMAIKELAINCNYGTHLDQALRDRLLMGVRNKTIQAKLIDQDNLTFPNACQTALNMELLSEELQNMCPQSADINSIKQQNKQQQQPYRGNGRSGESEQYSRRDRDVEGAKGRNNYIQCFYCKKLGHIQRNCFLRAKNMREGRYKNDERRVNYVNECKEYEEYEENNESAYINMIDFDKETVIDNKCKNVVNRSMINNINVPLYVYVVCNSVKIKMEIDTGACVSIINFSDFKKYFPNLRITESAKSLKVVSGNKLNLKGSVHVSIKLPNNKIFYEMELLIVDQDRMFIPLIGRSWLDIICVEWRSQFTEVNMCKQINESVKSESDYYKSKFSIVFDSDKTSCIKSFKARIVMKNDVVPVFCKAYTVAFGLRESVEQELERLVKDKIIYPVQFSDWASPIVIVQKTSGDIRICVDCKISINQYVKTDYYPLPRIDDILASLANCTHFCVLDLQGAYQQVQVDEDCQELLTINTQKGLFRYNRLVFGVKSAPAIFQSIMDQILKGLQNVECYLDDIVIGGKNLESCKNNLESVLERLQQNEVRVNVSKCVFFQEQIEYLGHIISKSGIQPSKRKLDAIINAPEPKDITQLRAYTGLLNYYAHFIPNLSTELKCLYDLTKKNVKFIWSNECKLAFEKSKRLLIESKILAHYDPLKQTIIHCDASPYGVGGILSQIHDGVERPVMFASSTLSAAEKNYSQLHREALAIMFSVHKFHKYIYGKKFTIYSDHQPLRDIFNPNKKIPALAAGRLCRWAVILSMYDYNIIYKKGQQMGNADALSRLPIQQITECEEDANIVAKIEEIGKINIETVRKETLSDKMLQNVINWIQEGWPQNVTAIYKPYFNKRLELIIDNGCIYVGHRIVIPARMIEDVLKILHDDSHVGIVRTKSVARNYVWWPGLDRDIEDFISSCKACLYSHKKPISNHLEPWPSSNYFFERVHVDFFHFQNSNFFIFVDTYSTWIDVKLMTSTNAASVIGVLRVLFGYFGLPNTLVSDNGPPFSSTEFTEFCKSNSIRVLNSPPYHPQSNGVAERAVQTVKTGLKKMDSRYK